MEIKYRTQFGELLESLGLKGDAVEVGCAECRNAQVLISQPAITKLYMIDAWEHLNQSGDGGYPGEWHSNNWKECHERVGPWKEKSVFLKGMSNTMIKEIPDDSLIFAYIDGDHSFDGCYSDLIGVFPKVKVGGVIACHDIKNMEYGVSDALRKCLLGDEKDYYQEDLHYTEEDGDEMMVSVWFIKK
jgi:hypothetical protein